jgi:hypothetical protein
MRHCPLANAGQHSILLIALLLMLTSAGCSATRNPDVPLASNRPAATDTNTPSPIPSNTPTITPTNPPDLTATAGAQKTAAVEPLFTDIQTVLTLAGVERGVGRIVYANTQPVTVGTSGWHSTNSEMVEGVGTVSNFIFHTNLTWNGEASNQLYRCAVDFRIDEKGIKAGAFYHLQLASLSGNGFAMDAYQGGIYWRDVGFGEMPEKHIGSGASNDMIVIARGSEFQVFFNHQKSGTYNDSRFTKGGFGYDIWTDTGKAECIFNNTWIWTDDK